jgi:hypothetical protein
MAATLYRLALVAFVFGGISLSGCASPATSTGMASGSFTVAKQHAHTVSVTVSGGRETTAYDPSQISNEAFSAALIETIKMTGVFSEVIEGDKAGYLLSVTIFRLQQPVIGFSMRPNMEAGWTLVRRATNQIVWQEALETDFVATTSDALIAAERSRLAAEGVARENIKMGIEKISRLIL